MEDTNLPNVLETKSNDDPSNSSTSAAIDPFTGIALTNESHGVIDLTSAVGTNVIVSEEVQEELAAQLEETTISDLKSELSAQKSLLFPT